MNNIIKPQYYDYPALKKALRALCDEYSFLIPATIGMSCAGRDINTLRLGKAEEYALITAAFHGSEHLTTTVLLMFIEELCRAVKNNDSIAGFNARKALFGRGVIFIPRVNPDGCEISLHGSLGCGALAKKIARLCGGDFEHWNANLRGVDINHNFDAGWEQLRERERSEGIYGPAPTRFGGYRPESEPETVALTELCRRGRIQHIVALHSQGEVIYWTYGDKRPPRSERMAELLATSSCYALDSATGIAEGGGFKDWFISEMGRPGFTVELGLGENPLPDSQAEPIYERVREMLTLASIM